jgi:hypothetical protein
MTSVSKYNFVEVDPSDDPIYFCVDLWDDRVKLNKNCQFNGTVKNCGIQNEGPHGWDNSFLIQDPREMGKKTIKMTQSLGCEGLVIDFEEVSVSNEDYLKWLREYVSVIEEHLYLSYAAYPKIKKISPHHAANIISYKNICSIFNEIWVMAYNYSIPPYTEIGEIAPLEWVSEVVDYAKISCKARQIRIGLAAYGYDWSNNKIVKEVDLNESTPESVRVETIEKRRRKIERLKGLGIDKYFIWAYGMYEQII